ncbi:MAG: hypothetical protein H7259_05250 [Cytophagales bacterium]|nr:hypothetical protein [Cytophaga sp.]
MEELEKKLTSLTLTDDSLITIVLNSNDRSPLKDLLRIVRRYSNSIVINYKVDLEATALVCVGKDTFALA